jgi:hypothetical protein
MRVSWWVIRALLVVVAGALLVTGIAAGSASATRHAMTHAVNAPRVAGHGLFAAHGINSPRDPERVVSADRFVASYGGPPGHGFATPLVHEVSTPPTVTAPPDVNQKQTAADAAVARRKVILAVVSALLLAIVYFGHRARSKTKAKKG